MCLATTIPVPPVSATICLLMDGAWDMITNATGMGWVFFRWSSFAMLGGGARASRASSALHAELLTCVAGLRKTLALGYRDLVIYTNSTELARISMGQLSVPISVVALRGACPGLRLARCFKVSRSLVACAHSLAVRARRRELLCHSFVA